MNAEIIAIGSEMLTGERVDTNSLYLTAELNKLGVEVVTKCVIGDDRDRLAAQVRQSMGRSAILILSGGLGPTEDDVTREAVAQALDRKLVFDTGIADWLAQRFAAAKRKMAEVNKRQAYVIQGADVLSNDRGTAPGQWLEESGAVAILLPGPPHELKSMFERHCLPRLARIVPKQAIRTLFLRVAGMGESDLDQLIAPVYKKYENPVTTILAAAGDIQIHLRARCATEAEAEALLAEVGGPIELLLGDRIYSRNGDPLEVVVGELLRTHARHRLGGGERHRRYARRALHQRAGEFGVLRGRLHHLQQRHEDGVARGEPGDAGGARRGEQGNRRSHGPGRAPPHQIHLRALHHRRRRTRRPETKRFRRAPCTWASPMPPALPRAQAVPGRSPTHPHLRRADGAGPVAPPDYRTSVATGGFGSAGLAR